MRDVAVRRVRFVMRRLSLADTDGPACNWPTSMARAGGVDKRCQRAVHHRWRRDGRHHVDWRASWQRTRSTAQLMRANRGRWCGSMPAHAAPSAHATSIAPPSPETAMRLLSHRTARRPSARIVASALIADGHVDSARAACAIERVRSRYELLEPDPWRSCTLLRDYCEDLLQSHHGHWPSAGQIDTDTLRPIDGRSRGRDDAQDRDCGCAWPLPKRVRRTSPDGESNARWSARSSSGGCSIRCCNRERRRSCRRQTPLAKHRIRSAPTDAFQHPTSNDRASPRGQRPVVLAPGSQHRDSCCLPTSR